MADQQPQDVYADPNWGAPKSATELHGDAYLATLSPQMADRVKAYAEGRLPFPGGFAQRSPFFQAMIGAATQYDPSFDAINYQTRYKTRAAFTSGKESQQVNAINTVIGHLSNLSDLADALHNGDFPMVNRLTNWFKYEMGNPSITNYQTAQKAVSDEVTRVWRQAGGAEADVQAARANLDVNNAPSQIHGAIQTYGHLLDSKLDSLRSQYKQGMGTDPIGMITPQSQQALDKLEQRAGGAPAPSGIKILRIEKQPQE